MVKAITGREELDQIISTAEGKLIVIDFFANWCGPCVRIAPKYAQLAEQYTDVIFLKVDVDEAGDFAKEYEVRSIPCFIFLKAGAVIDKVGGAREEELEKKIQEHK